MRLTPFPVLAAATLLVATPFAAQAQGRPAQGDWQVRLGAIALYGPDYLGSNDYEFGGAPDIEIVWRDRVFLGREGFGVNVVNAEDIRVALAIGYGGGRDQDDNAALRGLGDIDGTAELTGIVEYRLGAIALGASLTQDILDEGHGGTLASLSATYQTALGRTLVFAGPSLTWASDDYTQSYFGITPAQATRARRAAYAAEGGLRDVDFTVVAVHPLGGSWQLTGFASYTHLLGDAADSPLVAIDGDESQVTVGLGLSYQF